MEPQGRRERKRLETHRAFIHAARQLVEERGVDGVTVEEIADAAGYTARTFFNHFSCKEEAVVAIDPVTLTRLAEELRARPAAERPIDSLRLVLIGSPEAPSLLRRWQVRHELVVLHPRLLPRQLAAMEQVESVLALIIAERAGIDPAADPRVRMFVAGVLARLRAAVNWWSESDRSHPVEEVLAEAFDLDTDPLTPFTPRSG